MIGQVLGDALEVPFEPGISVGKKIVILKRHGWHIAVGPNALPHKDGQPGRYLEQFFGGDVQLPSLPEQLDSVH